MDDLSETHMPIANEIQPARRVYTATKKAIERCGQFKHMECNDQTFTIAARHGMSLLSFGENITIHVVATSTQDSEVRIESASRIFINILNGGANKKQIQLKYYCYEYHFKYPLHFWRKKQGR